MQLVVMCPAPARRPTCSCTASPSFSPTGSSEQDQKLRGEEEEDSKGQHDKHPLFLSLQGAHRPSTFPPCRWEARFPAMSTAAPRAQAHQMSALTLPMGASIGRGIPVVTASSSAPFHCLCRQRGEPIPRHGTLCRQQLPPTRGGSTAKVVQHPPFIRSLPNCNGS